MINSSRSFLYLIILGGLFVHNRDKPSRTNSSTELENSVISSYTERVNLGIINDSLKRLEQSAGDGREL